MRKVTIFLGHGQKPETAITRLAFYYWDVYVCMRSWEFWIWEDCVCSLYACSESDRIDSRYQPAWLRKVEEDRLEAEVDQEVVVDGGGGGGIGGTRS